MHIRWMGLLFLGLYTAVYAYDEHAPAGVDLSGRWAVNAKLSDDADTLLLKRLEKQLKREARWREEAAREEGAEAPGLINPAVESLSRPQVTRVLVQLHRALELYAVIEIKQSEAGAKLELSGEGNQRRFTVGRSAMSMPEGELADAEVGWDGDEFVVERKVRKGPQVVERYRLLKKTGQLQATISWRGVADDLLSGIKVKRVFDRSDDTPPPPNADVGPVP